MINMAPQELTVRVVSSGKLVTFNITETTLSVTHHGNVFSSRYEMQ